LAVFKFHSTQWRGLRTTPFLFLVVTCELAESVRGWVELSGMDERLAEIAAEIEREHARRDSVLFELCEHFRRYLDALSPDELRSHGAPIIKRRIEETMELAPTDDSLVQMLVGFYVEDLGAFSDEELDSLLRAFNNHQLAPRFGGR
jgi:hypothetical protein